MADDESGSSFLYAGAGALLVFGLLGAFAFLPRLFGDRLSTPTIPGAAGAFPEVALPYFGIVGAALAACVLRPGSRRPAAERALLVPLLFGVGAAIGLWPFAEIASNLPALGQAAPGPDWTWPSRSRRSRA